MGGSVRVGGWCRGFRVDVFLRLRVEDGGSWVEGGGAGYGGLSCCRGGECC